MTTIESFPDWIRATLAARPGPGSVGLIALATDANIEPELRSLLPPEIGMCTTRLANTDPITAETLHRTEGQIADAARRILPGHDVSALIYGCTAGAAVLGDRAVAARLREARPDAWCLSPVGAADEAMRFLGINRLSILTPNVRSLNEAIANYFARAGFDVRNVMGFEIDEDRDITRITPEAIAHAASRACDPQADGLLVSCTSLRATSAIERIEAEIGKPVVTSNQALAWSVLRRFGFPGRRAVPGQLGSAG